MGVFLKSRAGVLKLRRFLGLIKNLIFTGFAGITLSVSLLTLSFVIAVSWILYHPEQSWRWIEAKLLPVDLKISCDSMRWQAEREDWLRWKVTWDITGLKAEKSAPEFVLPPTSTHLGVTIGIQRPFLQINELRVKLSDGGYFKPDPNPPRSSDENPFQTIKAVLDQIRGSQYLSRLHQLNLIVPNFEIRGAAPFEIQLRADNSIKLSEFTYDLTLIPLYSKTSTWKLTSKGLFDPLRIDSNDAFLTSQILFTAKGLRGDGKLIAKYNGSSILVTVQPKIIILSQKKQIRIHSDIGASIDAKLMQTQFQTKVMGLPNPLNDPELRGEIIVPLQAHLGLVDPGISFVVSTPLKLFFIDSKMRKPLEKSCNCKIPEVLEAKLYGNYWPRDKKADMHLELESLTNRLLSLDFKAKSSIEFKNDRWELSPELDSHLVIHSYQGLRRFLDARGVMIPAPLDVLEGSIDLRAEGPVIMGETFSGTSVQASTLLRSKNQLLALRSTTMFKLSRDFKQLDVGLKVVVDDLKMELPPIDPIRGLPKLTTDRRFLKLPKEIESRNFKVLLTMDFETTKSNSIQLLSKLIKPYVPIGLRIYQSGPAGVGGYVASEPFEVHYLRRVAKVEVMRIDLKPVALDEYPIQGRIRIDQTQYKIFIGLTGTTRQPRVELSSEPYLPRADIISVLLYDRTTDQLVTGDLETVGSVEAAMADRAIGLFGLWLFATTPIRSFSYNAITKVYSATLLLADGLTLGVGTNWEQTTYVEVRKRLSRRWVLTATWRPEDETPSSGNLVLQWEKRF